MSDLDRRFKKAYEIASNMTKKLPPDVMLLFYAYYKQAIIDNPFVIPSGEDLRSAFKLNAWLQINHLTQDEAKEKYIELVEKHNNLKIE